MSIELLDETLSYLVGLSVAAFLVVAFLAYNYVKKEMNLDEKKEEKK